MYTLHFVLRAITYFRNYRIVDVQYRVVRDVIVKRVYSTIICRYVDLCTFSSFTGVYRTVPRYLQFNRHCSLPSRAEQFSRDGTKDRCKISRQLHGPFLNMSDTILLLPLRALKSVKTIKFSSCFYSAIINADNRPSSRTSTTIVRLRRWRKRSIGRGGSWAQTSAKGSHKQVMADRRVQSLLEEEKTRAPAGRANKKDVWR